MKNQNRNSSGRYARNRGWSTLFVVLVIFGGIIAYGAYMSTKQVYIAKNKIEKIIKPTFEEKVAKVKKEILKDLSLGCEVKGAKDPDGVIIFDSNNEASIGRFQFQRKTVIYYYKMFYSKDITAHEAIEISIDPIRSEELAEKILFQDKGKGADNWFNCNNKMDIGARVKLLKEIME